MKKINTPTTQSSRVSKFIEQYQSVIQYGVESPNQILTYIDLALLKNNRELYIARCRIAELNIPDIFQEFEEIGEKVNLYKFLLFCQRNRISIDGFLLSAEIQFRDVQNRLREEGKILSGVLGFLRKRTWFGWWWMTACKLHRFPENYTHGCQACSKGMWVSIKKYGMDK